MTNILIIETAITVLVYLALRILINRSIGKIVAKNNEENTRSKIIKKVINTALLLVFSIIILSIFGVNQSELLVFIGSVLTVIGIALFAQWSILSNITSGIIIFLNHPVKPDDTLVVIDKDYSIEGRIIDIGLMFVSLKTKDNEHITIPNNVFIQKMIKKKANA